MGFGGIVSILMSLSILLVARLVVRVLCLLRVVVLALGPMLLALCVFLLLGVEFTRFVAVRVVGLRSASVPVWLVKRAFPVCLVRWLAR